MFRIPFTHRAVRTRPTPMLAKVAVCAAILGCSVTLVALHVGLSESRAQLDALSGQAAALEQQQQDLTEKVEKLGTVESYLRIAAEELGLVEPDTIIIESE